LNLGPSASPRSNISRATTIKEFTHLVSPDELQAIYDQFIAEHRTDQARREFVLRIVGGRDGNEEAGTYEDQ
jgi:hypothetical protein